MNLIFIWLVKVFPRAWVNFLVSKVRVSIHVCEILVILFFYILQVNGLYGARFDWDSLFPVPSVVFIELSVVFSVQWCLILVLEGVLELLLTWPFIEKFFELFMFAWVPVRISYMARKVPLGLNYHGLLPLSFKPKLLRTPIRNRRYLREYFLLLCGIINESSLVAVVETLTK